MHKRIVVLLSLVLAGCAMPGTRSARVSVKELEACAKVRDIRSTTVDSVSRDGATLVVLVLDRARCDLHAKKPTVKLVGSSVELSWEWVPEVRNQAMKCLCGRRLEFRVEGAPAGDVSVVAAASR